MLDTYGTELTSPTRAALATALEDVEGNARWHERHYAEVETYLAPASASESDNGDSGGSGIASGVAALALAVMLGLYPL